MMVVSIPEHPPRAELAMKCRVASATVALILYATTGCASLPPGRLPDAQDPFERFNRAAFSFNDALDRTVVRPIASAYTAVVPDIVQRGVANFFGNLSDVPSALNALLQGKPNQAATLVGRFAVNTTVGLAGLLDPATVAGLERRREDFGQTLGVWGIEPGPYLVLPLLGPSSVRDSFGLVVDLELDPLLHVSDKEWRYGLTALRLVQQRAFLIGTDTTLRSIELDPYLFTRDAYLARRRNATFDGDPPAGTGDTSPVQIQEASPHEPKP